MKPLMCWLATVIVAASFSPVVSREIPREEYLRYVPLSHPRLTQQTEASLAFQLFGDSLDPAYVDRDPVDGIDDARGELLTALAVRFAPFLVQNTTNIPVNFDIYVENGGAFPLVVDTWLVSSEDPKLLASDSIDLAGLGETPCPPGTDRSVRQHDDCKLLALIDDLGPGREPPVRSQIGVKPRPNLFTVLYMNFPGEGAGTWKQAYKPEYDRTPEDRRPFFPHAYVHPFIHAVQNSDSTIAGYDFVLQYWFFYPSNDGGNNHEGDWEHINVVISPKSMVTGPLSKNTIAAILAGAYPATDAAADPLVIRRVEHYFHHFVMTLDYSLPNVYLPREEWKAVVKSLPTTRYQEREIWESIRRNAYVDDDESVINTHPFGYIGADNKGLDQILSMPGGRNRDSHGTYPFPGRYNSIGPAGATEQVSVHVDPRLYLRRLQEGKATMGPEFKRGSVLGLADSRRLRLVPDWERVINLIRTDAQVRREWSWLVLPILFGYPATESPFAGIVEHTETGNLPPSGPAFNPGWNVSGPVAGFSTYEPHTMPSIFPVGLYDGFRNDLGFLNLTVPVLFNLPPADFLGRVALYPFKAILQTRDPLYYPQDGLPARFISFSSGISRQTLDEDFQTLAINRDQLIEFEASLIFHLLLNGSDSTTTVTGGREFQEASTSPFYQMAFYIGRHFTSENTVRNVRSTFGVEAEFNNIPPYRYSADVNLWEYAGSIRYSLLPSRIQPFLKAGYGWSWYRLENAQVNGVPFNLADSRWYGPGGVLPNVWHYGLGIEFMPWKRVGKYFHGIEVALRFEYVRYIQNLGLDLSEIPLENLQILFPTLGDVPTAKSVARDELLFGLAVSF